MADHSFLFRLRGLVIASLLAELVFWGLMYLLLTLTGTSETGQLGLDFRFPEVLQWLWLILPLHLAFFYLLHKKNKSVEGLGPASVLTHIIPEVSSFRAFVQFLLFRSAIVFTILAMAQPALGSKSVKATRDNTELVLVVDLSNSMYAHDAGFEYRRLEIMKHGLEQLVKRLHGEQVGLVVFAGNAYIQLPLTHDYGSAHSYIRELNPDMISEQGTNLELALEAGLSLYSREDHPRNMILVTDGEHHEGQAHKLTQRLREAKIAFGCIGIGSEAGSFVPNNPERPELGYKRDASGQRVISRLNSKLIQKLASESGGVSLIVHNDFPDFASVVEQLHQAKRSVVSEVKMTVKENYYQVPLFFGAFSWLFFMLYSVFFPVYLKKD